MLQLIITVLVLIVVALVLLHVLLDNRKADKDGNRITFLDLLEKHKLARRLSLLWAVCLITAVTIRVFWYTPTVPESTAHALEIVVGVLAVVIGFYKWSRHREGQFNKDGEG